MQAPDLQGSLHNPQMTPAQLLVKGAITHVQDKTASGSGGVRIKGFKIGGKSGKSEVNATVYVVDSTRRMWPRG